jgi:chromate reductase, NAD(P)H dehydrogenase (quinone)
VRIKGTEVLPAHRASVDIATVGGLMHHPLRLLLISGSLRGGSTNTAALRTARTAAPPETEAVLYDGIGALPHFNPDDDRDGATVHPAVATLRAAIADADGLLLCTPEYAGALPGSFKNLLEWTVGDAGTYRKPVAWINVSGVAAPTGGADAHDSLRKVLGYVGARIVEPACVRIPLARSDIGEDGEITSDTIRGQIRDVLAVFAEDVRAQDASAASA